MQGSIVSPRCIVPTIPLELDAIAMQALAKEPKRRYVNAKALADDLARFLRGEPVQARGRRRRDQLLLQLKQHFVLAGVSGFFALILILLLAVLIAAYSRSNLANVELRAEVVELEQVLQSERLLSRRALAAARSTSSQASDEESVGIDAERLSHHALALTTHDPKLAGLLIAEVIEGTGQIDPQLSTFLQQVPWTSDESRNMTAPARVVQDIRQWAGRSLTETERRHFGIAKSRNQIENPTTNN